MPFLIALAMLAGQVEEALPALADSAVVQAVRATFKAEPGLVRHHRGYLGLTEAEPAIGAVEEAFAELAAISGFRAAVWDFDDALWRNPDAEALFDRFEEALAADDALRALVYDLDRVPSKDRELGRRHSDAITWLKAHPGDALAFLDRPSRLLPVPGALRELRHHLRMNEDTRIELERLFRALDAMPDAHQAVFPWWSALNGNGDIAWAWHAMTAHFARYSNHGAIWSRRETVLAGQPHRRDWIRYWWRRVRLEEGPGWMYAEYLKHVWSNPDFARAEAARWAEELAAPPEPWPPKETPPALAPPIRPDQVDTKPIKPHVERPSSPTAPTIHKPTAPIAPTPPKPTTPTPPRAPDIEKP